MHKLYISAFLQCAFVISLFAQPQPRPMVWCDGANATSDGWLKTFVRQEFEAQGYLFDQLVPTDTYFDALAQGSVELGDFISSEIGSEGNVLGIAHDMGGLGLRYAQSLNQNITAMVLDGVPNQGSLALLNSGQSLPGSLSKMQALLEDVRGIQGTDNCDEFCDVVANFESWVNEIEGGQAFYRDAYTDSDFLINDVPSEPSVPYIVLVGEIPSFSLTRLLDSRGSLTNGNELRDCYREAIERARGEITFESDLLIKETRNVFTNLLTFFSQGVNKGIVGGDPVFGSGAVSDVVGASASFIEKERQDKYARIRINRELSEELRRILRCELSNRYLEAEWLISLLDGEFIEEEEEIDCDAEYDQCVDDCEYDVAWGDGPQNGMTCAEYCAQNYDPDCENETITVEYFIIEPMDGLLTVSEQKLPGSNLVTEIRLEDTDHIEESQRTTGFMMETLDDIFLGVYGAEFVVPKS